MTAATPGSAEDPATRFARETQPLLSALSRRARSLTPSDADAEDLLQDALMHAYIGFHTFQEGTNLKAWLFRILHNRWVSAHRFKQRRPAEVAVGIVGDLDAAALPTSQRSAEAEVLKALPDDDVWAAMHALPARFRSVIYYADVQGYTYAETAAILDIPVGTVMSRMSRGRQRLRVALAHRAPARGQTGMVESCSA